jgi:outer membrane cobalamin receptor
MKKVSGRFVFAVSLFACATVFAQERIAVSGTVTDISGAVVPGAFVDVLAAGGVVAAATTASDGRYRLEVPARRSYRLRTRLQGFEENTAALTPSTDTTHDVTLRIAALGDTLIVTASRTGETRASSTASTAVFSAADLRALGSRSLGDVLRAAPGLNVESPGREGALTSLFSRGGESDYNLVLVDGVRVNQTGGMFDFSRISAAEIDRVEIVRGGQSSLYGSDAIGSVVHVFTRRPAPADRPRVTGSVEGGSFAARRADASVAGGALGRLDYVFGASYRETSGAFAEILPEDDEFDQASLNGGFGAVLGDRATLRAGIRYSTADSRSVGPLDLGSRDSGTAYQTEDLSWHVALTHRYAPTLTGAATFAYSRADAVSIDAIADPTYQLYAVLSGTPGARFPASPRLVRFVDEAAFDALGQSPELLPAGQFLASTPFGVGDFTFEAPTSFRRPAFSYKADWMWRDTHTLSGGYEFEHESDPLAADFDIANHAFFAQQQFRLHDRWFATVGGRVDRNSEYGTHLSPRLSAGGYLLPLGAGAISSVKVFSNVGTGIKNPVFSELFGGAFADGNPALTAERARTFDAGVELTLDGQRWRTSLVYFDNDYDDQVAFRSTGPGRDGRPDFVNIAGSAASGWEVEAALQRPVAGMTAAASYALVDTEVTATTSTSAQFQPGQPLLRRPRHSGFVRLGYVAGPVTVNADARVVGQRHDATFLGFAASSSPGAAGTPVDITVNPGYVVVGLGVDYRLRGATGVFLRLDNIMDEAYASVLGYPGLPRSASVGVRFGVGGGGQR